jgi:hypothetical protein
MSVDIKKARINLEKLIKSVTDTVLAKRLDWALKTFVESIDAIIREYESDIADRDARLVNIKTALDCALDECRIHRQLDVEAHESFDALLYRTRFNMQWPRVGWRGVALSMEEALNDRDRLLATINELLVELDNRDDVERDRNSRQLIKCVLDKLKSIPPSAVKEM